MPHSQNEKQRLSRSGDNRSRSHSPMVIDFTVNSHVDARNILSSLPNFVRIRGFDWRLPDDHTNSQDGTSLLNTQLHSDPANPGRLLVIPLSYAGSAPMSRSNSHRSGHLSAPSSAPMSRASSGHNRSYLSPYDIAAGGGGWSHGQVFMPQNPYPQQLANQTVYYPPGTYPQAVYHGGGHVQQLETVSESSDAWSSDDQYLSKVPGERPSTNRKRGRRSRR